MMLFIGIILFVAAVVQGLIGFAMAIVAIPLLVWIGLPLSEAIAISMASTMVQALTGMFKLRHAIPWRIVRSSLAVRSLSLPIGILIMVQLDGIETSEVKAVLGLEGVISRRVESGKPLDSNQAAAADGSC